LFEHPTKLICTVPKGEFHGNAIEELPPFRDQFLNFHYKEYFVQWKGSIDVKGFSWNHQCQNSVVATSAKPMA